MKERQVPPPEKLFELLEFCGLRQRDIVRRLGVSKALVSLWRSGQRAIPLNHYQALCAFAGEGAVQGVRALVQHPPPAPGVVQEALAVFEVFEAKLMAAVAERDPTPIHQQLQFSIVTLAATLDARGDPASWDEETLAYVVAEAQTIADAAKALQIQVTARRQAAAFQARTTATLRELIATREEPPHAEIHE